MKKNEYINYALPKEGSGWYRIAKRDGGSTIDASGCEIIIKRPYHNINSEFHHIYFTSVFQKSKFVSIVNFSNGHVIKKIRNVLDKTNRCSYIEIYISSGALNGYYISLTNNYDCDGKWENHGFEKTEETVDGCTILSSMDIPANSNVLDSNPDRKYYSISSSVDTGIDVNQGAGGKTLLALISGHADATTTYSTVAFIKLDHSGGSVNICDLGSKLSWLMTVSVSENGTLILNKVSGYVGLINVTLLG